MSAEQQGFIAARFNDLEAVKKSQQEIQAIHAAAISLQTHAAGTGAAAEKIKTITSRTWVVAALVLAIALAALALSFYLLRELAATEARLLAEIRLRKPPATTIVTVNVKQWTSAAFEVGVTECAVTGRQASNPCDCWIPNDEARDRSCITLEELVDRHRDANMIFAVGAHDRVVLNSAGKAKFGSNDNVALERARSVSTLLRRELAAKQGNACDPSLDPDCIPAQPLVRGSWDKHAQSASDRTVTVTLLHSEQKS